MRFVIGRELMSVGAATVVRMEALIARFTVLGADETSMQPGGSGDAWAILMRAYELTRETTEQHHRGLEPAH
jgi:hypothetical protein